MQQILYLLHLEINTEFKVKVNKYRMYIQVL